MSNQSIRVVAHIVAIPEKLDAVREILMELIEPTCQEEGYIKYELLQNQADSTDFTFVEEWSSNAALDAHLASNHIAAAGDKLKDLIAFEPDIRRYKLLA